MHLYSLLVKLAESTALSIWPFQLKTFQGSHGNPSVGCKGSGELRREGVLTSRWQGKGRMRGMGGKAWVGEE